MIDHPRIDEIKWEIRGRDGNWKRTLVVMTNLCLDPTSAHYSGSSEAELLRAVNAFWESNPDLLDAVNVRSTRQD